MIWQPRNGQRVRLHYAEKKRPGCPYHGRTGTVVYAGIGPGPRNARVVLDGDGWTIVPRGNLVAIGETDEQG